MKAKIALLLAIATMSVSLAGCGSSKTAKIETKNEMEAMYVASEKEAPVEANPRGAISAVYDQLEGYDAKELSNAEVERLVGITKEDALDVIAYYSDAKSVLADVIIVKPYPSLREDVRGKLVSYREIRVREFTDFDILNAHSIAKDAVIYDQGEYLVLLMLEDNEAAQGEIDGYIPQ